LVRIPLGINKKTGNRSVLISPSSLDEITPATISDDVINALEETEEQIKETHNFIPFAGCIALVRINEGVEEGLRDEAGFFKTRIYLMAGLSEKEAEAALWVWNKNNRPPLSDSQLRKIVSSVYSKAYSISSWSIRKNRLLSKFCSGCINPICEHHSRRRKRRREEIDEDDVPEIRRL